MMQARCPACQTVFRVRPEQLRAHHGRVRCGHCYAPFDALEHLQDDASASPALQFTDAKPKNSTFGAEAPAPPMAPAEPAPPPSAFDALEFGLIDAHQEVGKFDKSRREEPSEPERRGDFDQISDHLDFEIPDALISPRHPFAGAAPTMERTEARDTENAFPEFVDLSDLTPLPPPTAPNPYSSPSPFAMEEPDATYSDQGTEPHYLAADDASTARNETDTEEHPPQDQPAETAFPVAFESEPAPEIQPDVANNGSPEEIDEAVEQERLDATYGPPPTARRHWAWGLGAGLLMGILAAQSTYLFREEITRQWPQLRPAFITACAQFGCTVPLSRVAGAISIETSDLQAQPRNPGRFVLNATVKNRAPYPQAYPHLELTLTDTQDRPAVRRVLAPDEWVPEPGLTRNFLANEEIVLRLPFAASGIEAVGYRVYAFYP